jgi:hypothetical protein
MRRAISASSVPFSTSVPNPPSRRNRANAAASTSASAALIATVTRTRAGPGSASGIGRRIVAPLRRRDLSLEGAVRRLHARVVHAASVSGVATRATSRALV